MWVTHSSSLDGWNVWGTIGDLKQNGSPIMPTDLFSYAEDNWCVSEVYMATNLVNGKRYIGITRKGLAHRIGSHFSRAKGGSKLKFHNAIRKYGQAAFRFDVIHKCETYQEAKEKERSYIAEFNPEYNMTLGGDGVLGLRITDETRKLMSLRKKGKPSPRRGIPHSQETKDRLREIRIAKPTKYWLGKKRSADTFQKIEEAKRQNGFYDRLKKLNASRQRAVYSVTDGIAFQNAYLAADFYGCSFSNIARVCRIGNERPWKVKKHLVWAEDWFL